MRTLLVTSLLLVFVAACASSRGGKGGADLFPSDAKHEAAAKASTLERAKFDLDCEDIELSRLGDVTRLGQQMTSMTLGARGCGQKATYYAECVSNWGKVTCTPQLNSKEDAASTTPADAGGTSDDVPPPPPPGD